MFEIMVFSIGIYYIYTDYRCRKAWKEASNPGDLYERFFVSNIRHLQGENLEEKLKKSK